jgi:hypothetical protein
VEQVLRGALVPCSTASVEQRSLQMRIARALDHISDGPCSDKWFLEIEVSVRFCKETRKEIAKSWTDLRSNWSRSVRLGKPR